MRFINSHMHLENSNPRSLIALADKFNYEKLCVLAISCRENILNTLECMLMKRLAPERVYVYGGIAYIPGVEPTAKDHEKQLELMMEAGCDGWKLLESKPSVYRALQHPLDSELFDRAFSLAESARIPLKWHAGDPATFWDPAKAPAFAAENGWLCVGEGFPSLEKIYSEVENVMRRHPKLHASLAHLYFISDDRPHGERMLDTYENFTMDITPGTEMYEAFLPDREGWAAFFRRWQDKLIFGTDMPDLAPGEPLYSDDSVCDLIYKTLATSDPFEELGIAGAGLGLEYAIVKKICAENFERITGKTPRLLSKSGLHAYAEWLLPKLPPDYRLRAEALLADNL
ncbi:MAG: amidohydrolase family protein [Clostridia bacterium]|nr:amidohydrolase family protein [Clostridia bacterium]